MTTMPARVIHISIERPWQTVYAYASKPPNMPHWASGLAAGLRQDGKDWIGDGGPIGEIRIRFAPDNVFGVIDHTVTLSEGAVVENALRVVPNGDGAEVMFTLLRRPGVDDAGLEADAAHILGDLRTLKAILEKQ